MVAHSTVAGRSPPHPRQVGEEVDGAATGESGPAAGAAVAVAVVPRSAGASSAATPKAILEIDLRLRSNGVPSFAGMVNGALSGPEGRTAGSSHRLTTLRNRRVRMRDFSEASG
ncbi:hypothetical protein GCM10010342_30760 [Streptomyces anulatus]|nr:hypothetical protein GCM10010342_30760 [Streptomyces anulatus]